VDSTHSEPTHDWYHTGSNCTTGQQQWPAAKSTHSTHSSTPIIYTSTKHATVYATQTCNLILNCDSSTVSSITDMYSKRSSVHINKHSRTRPTVITLCMTHRRSIARWRSISWLFIDIHVCPRVILYKPSFDNHRIELFLCNATLMSLHRHL